MDLPNCQRPIFAFHGCDRRVRDAVLVCKVKLLASLNTYEWLDQGICFWEHGPRKQRAELIRQGTLTPEGNLPVYPMDHVPFGPKE